MDDTPKNIWPSVGVLFEIDHLGTTPEEQMNYGSQARKIFVKHFHPSMASPSFLWHGDTQETLNGNENRFCIAVSASTRALESITAAFAHLSDAGLVSPEERFCRHPFDLDLSTGTPRAIHVEPLNAYLSINKQGEVVFPKPIFYEDVILCRQHGWKYRMPALEDGYSANDLDKVRLAEKKQPMAG